MGDEASHAGEQHIRAHARVFEVAAYTAEHSAGKEGWGHVLKGDLWSGRVPFIAAFSNATRINIECTDSWVKYLELTFHEVHIKVD